MEPVHARGLGFDRFERGQPDNSLPHMIECGGVIIVACYHPAAVGLELEIDDSGFRSEVNMRNVADLRRKTRKKWARRVVGSDLAVLPNERENGEDRP